MGSAVRPDPAPSTGILSGDDWERAQYAPHRAGQDPTKPMAAGRILTGEEWDKAHSAGSFDALTFPALPKLPTFASDATKRLNPNAPKEKGTPLAAFDIRDPSTYINPVLRQVVNPALEHPVASTAMMAAPFAAAGLPVVGPAAGLAIGLGMAGSMVHHIAQYGWQKAHELAMSDEDRATAEADPNRISGESAAMQAIMLGLAPLIHVGMKAASVDVGAGMMEAGAQGVKETNLGPDFRPGSTDAPTAADQTAALQQKVSLYFETPKGAEVLGTMAARHGMPETASPYPPDSPLAAAWQQGHATVTPPSEPAPVGMQDAGGGSTVPADNGPAYRNPASLYKRLSNDALVAEYRALIEKRTTEQPSAETPLWTPEREAAAVEEIENRRRPDGSLSPADERQLAALQAAQGEEYYVGRHTKESAAAERRVTDMTKHITAIEKEIGNRGLNADDLMQQPQGEGGKLASVEGTGDLKTRGLSASVEQTAIAKDLTDYLGDLPQYRSVNMADQAAKAVQLIADDPELARRVALGEVPAPHGLHPESVLIAVENKALAEGDVGTIRDLASGGLTEEATTMGQRIRALRDRDPDSPVVAIQKIEDARGGGKNVQAIHETVADINTHLDNVTKIEPDALAAFIDSLRC